MDLLPPWPRNQHIAKGIPVNPRLPTYLAFNHQGIETSRQPPSAHVVFSKRQKINLGTLRTDAAQAVN
jgi:hypothetical protein